jgi:hypothetical protein
MLVIQNVLVMAHHQMVRKSEEKSLLSFFCSKSCLKMHWNDPLRGTIIFRNPSKTLEKEVVRGVTICQTTTLPPKRLSTVGDASAPTGPISHSRRRKPTATHRYPHPTAAVTPTVITTTTPSPAPWRLLPPPPTPIPTIAPGRHETSRLPPLRRGMQPRLPPPSPHPHPTAGKPPPPPPPPPPSPPPQPPSPRPSPLRAAAGGPRLPRPPARASGAPPPATAWRSSAWARGFRRRRNRRSGPGASGREPPPPPPPAAEL